MRLFRLFLLDFRGTDAVKCVSLPLNKIDGTFPIRTAAMHLRRWIRFPSEIGTVTLRQDDHRRLMADVLDESFAGMGLSMVEAGLLEENDRVRVSYRGQPMDARIRHVSPMGNGQYRVGMEWTARPPRLRLVTSD
jgi:hypothetical protein